ncbi:hypothetical protein BC332_12906 [Capsicum chinense]|nr:hypothetical protein BC332_12906 [Capsicum chinense]
MIRGNLPKEIGNLSQLAFLNLSNNQLTETIFNICSLEIIDLGGNNLSGRIPFTTGLHLLNLQGLDLGDNQLEGELPVFIVNASKLEILGIGDNFLTGTIPNDLGNLRELQRLHLHHNQLTNEPREHELQFINSLASCMMLHYLQVVGNPLNGVLPNSIGNLSSTIEYFHMGDAQTSGFIPTSIGNMSGLKSLVFQRNNLMGNIPPEIGNLEQLQEGEVPLDIGGLKAIVELHLSGNHFSGKVPSRLGELQNLQSLDLSNNSFSGSIPLSFANLISLVFLDLSLNVLSGNNFDGSNLIGVGSSVSVYKGTLSSGTLVARKVVNFENEKVCKRFDTECEVMRNVRHRNLVPVITTCSSDYIRAFLLQFMPNGSLENWLYKEDCQLNLLQRVTVMLDVAMGIKYLHHGNDTPIVHCDLKPANILLDEYMVAHVGDFGISKILAVSKSMAHTETLGTLGYIAPEYGSEGIVSTTGDVYSYGIMLMEVLTKRRPIDEEIHNENVDLRKWITQSFPRTMMDVVDANLLSEDEKITSKCESCIACMIELALDCPKEMAESRITMKEVVKRLNKIKNTFLEL